MTILPLQDNVSRETFDSLQQFQALLLRWTKSINLVGSSTVSESWQRHIVDSAQVFDFLPKGEGHLIDMGSGGGLPGLVIAILAKKANPDLRITLVESDQRKAVFLRTAAREIGLPATILCQRIECTIEDKATIVTARALASLDQLLGFADALLAPGGVAVFQKGRRADAELKSARLRWTFDLDSHKSQTDADARILVIKDIRRAES